eukprot:289770-Prymnesium_polylepis.1
MDISSASSADVSEMERVYARNTFCSSPKSGWRMWCTWQGGGRRFRRSAGRAGQSRVAAVCACPPPSCALVRLGSAPHGAMGLRFCVTCSTHGEVRDTWCVCGPAAHLRLPRRPHVDVHDLHARPAVEPLLEVVLRLALDLLRL